MGSDNGSFGRIEWCDIFKGIVIILVVVGHTTGKFNQYIYQFHMAAFFFISGYTAKVGKNTLFEEIIQKFYKLKFPFYVISFFGIFLFWIFQKTGILSLVSTTVYPERFWDALKALLKTNTVYCDWLGAIWFLPALFLSTLLFKIILKLCKNTILLAFVSVFVFFYSMDLTRGGGYYHNLDIAGIAQVYMVMGYLTHKIKEKGNATWQLLLKAAVLVLIWNGLIAFGYRNTVDWPVRRFNGPSDLLLPVCGIWLTIIVAKLLSNMPYVKKLFIYLGQNSMGVMCLHFIGFKVAYLFLVWIGKMNFNEICYLTPPETVKWDFWIFISATAIAFSACIWDLLNRLTAAKWLLGGGSAAAVYQSAVRIKPVGRLKDGYDWLASKVEKAVENVTRLLKKSRYAKAFAVIGIIAALAVSVLIVYDGGKIQVSFPYRKKMVAFEEGWFPQSKQEQYRWIEKDARFTAYLLDQDYLELTGYIPQNVDNMSYISLKINGREAYREKASCDQQIEIRMDISEYVEKYGKNLFEIEMDGARNPDESEADQREFSALVNSILIY